MSTPDVATPLRVRSLLPSVASASPSGVVVRWVLRAATVIIFAVATVVGVSVALMAPTESPASIGERRR